MNQYVQGDILFVEVSEIPKDATPENTKIVAIGEATGHQHVIEGAGSLFHKWEIGEWGLRIQNRFLLADEDIEIRHDEHPSALLPKGTYQIKQQRTYNQAAAYRMDKAEKKIVD